MQGQNTKLYCQNAKSTLSTYKGIASKYVRGWSKYKNVLSKNNFQNTKLHFQSTKVYCPRTKVYCQGTNVDCQTPKVFVNVQKKCAVNVQKRLFQREKGIRSDYKVFCHRKKNWRYKSVLPRNKTKLQNKQCAVKVQKRTTKVQTYKNVLSKYKTIPS